jgi:hypothetical protein
MANAKPGSDDVEGLEDRMSTTRGFHIGWKHKSLEHFCVVAFWDGKPDSTPDQGGGMLFLKML